MTHFASSMNGHNNGPVPGAFTFDDSLFSFNPELESTVSQPFQAALPSTKPAAPKGIKREASSPPLERRSPPASSPTHDSNYSVYSSQNRYLDPEAGSPLGLSLGGYSGGTTPGFDTLEELPDLNRVDTFDLPTGLEEEQPALESTASQSKTSRYPPSPRLTLSPVANAETTPPNVPNGNILGSPIVKIEHHSPNTPISRHQQSNSSSSTDLPVDIPIIRDDDGNWRGGAGLDPNARDDTYLPLSIKELEFERAKQQKIAEVEQWLKRSMEQLPRPKNTTNGGLSAPSSGRHRARSISDFRAQQVSSAGANDAVQPGESSANRIHMVDETEDYHYDDDDSSLDSDWREGSLDESLDDNEAPPTAEDLRRTEEEEKERERLERERDPQFHPNPRQFFSRHPWVDIAPPVTRGATAAMRTQPATAVAAMQKFTEYARNIETASRVATFGSGHTRRNSTGDADKVGVALKRLSFGREKKESSPRRPSIWGGFSSSIGKNLKRSLSNSTGDSDKEKDKDKDKDRLTSPVSNHRARGSSFGSAIGNGTSPFAPSRLTSSSFAPSLRLDTSTKSTGGIVSGAFAQMASPLMAAGAGSGLPTSPTAPQISEPPQKQASSTATSIMHHLKRSRSRSDLQRKHVFGVVTSLMGPALPGSAGSGATAGSSSSPAPSTTSPATGSGDLPRSPRKFTFGEEAKSKGVKQANQLLSPDSAHRRGDGEEFDVDMDDDCISPEYPVQRKAPQHSNPQQISQHQRQQAPSQPAPAVPAQKYQIVPTLEGFADHIRHLNPQLPQKLVDRFAHEQCKRFRKLVEYRQKHLKALNEKGMCPNGPQLCRKTRGAIGVGSVGSVGVAGHRRGNSASNFANDGHDSDPDSPSTSAPPHHNPSASAHDLDTTLSTASFPPHIPIPPTSHLPASFECPICFRSKKFQKPSDWTKHVHEDVQPFTCTFPACTEPKSFKRKADWVRHENERHRHLEWWKCNQPDCGHTCYRKDNFVQHLVREHKMVEPKRKTSATSGRDGQTEQLWRIVDACHQETTQPAQSEQCRFCGASCGSFKKLTVHLARHMEAIALPILELVTDDAKVPAAPARGRRVGAGGVYAAANISTAATVPHAAAAQAHPPPQHNLNQQPMHAAAMHQHQQHPHHQLQNQNHHQQPTLSMSTANIAPMNTSVNNNNVLTPVTPEMMTPISMVNIPTYQLTPPPSSTTTAATKASHSASSSSLSLSMTMSSIQQQQQQQQHLQYPHPHPNRNPHRQQQHHYHQHQRTPSAPELASVNNLSAPSMSASGSASSFASSSPNMMHHSLSQQQQQQQQQRQQFMMSPQSAGATAGGGFEYAPFPPQNQNQHHTATVTATTTPRMMQQQQQQTAAVNGNGAGGYVNLMPMNPNGNASTGFQTENEDGDVCMGGINGYPMTNGMNGMNTMNVNALGMDMGMGMEMGVDGYMYHQHQTQQQQQQQQRGW